MLTIFYRLAILFKCFLKLYNLAKTSHVRKALKIVPWMLWLNIWEMIVWWFVLSCFTEHMFLGGKHIIKNVCFFCQLLTISKKGCWKLKNKRTDLSFVVGESLKKKVKMRIIAESWDLTDSMIWSDFQSIWKLRI